jgi:hypothetical protein
VSDSGRMKIQSVWPVGDALRFLQARGLLRRQRRQRGGATAEEHAERDHDADRIPHDRYRSLIGGTASDERSVEAGGSAGSDRSMTAFTGRA